ncbi:YdbL family protein [Verrucomicrobia bacterium]|nr:YdbL family protein [Verrucomicrobiota bacterium]
MKTQFPLILLFSLSFLLVPFVQADSSFASTMKERLPEVIKAKGEGSVGEGVDGLLHIRAEEASAELEKMVASENKDREALFANLAKKTKGSTAEAAKIFAKAMIGKGKKGHWFRSSKGAWKQK